MQVSREAYRVGMRSNDLVWDRFCTTRLATYVKHPEYNMATGHFCHGLQHEVISETSGNSRISFESFTTPQIFPTSVTSGIRNGGLYARQLYIACIMRHGSNIELYTSDIPTDTKFSTMPNSVVTGDNSDDTAQQPLPTTGIQNG